MDDFTVLTEEDKDRAAYLACVGGMTLVGMAVGRFGGLPGLVLGGGVGLAVGIKACRSPMLQEPIRQKIFSAHARLTDHEVLAALRAIWHERPGISKSDAMAVLAQVRANSRTGKNSCQA
jgi:hypothetical protein